MFCKIFFIVIISAAESLNGLETSEEKYIDLLPETEKKNFLEKIAKRILEEIDTTNTKKNSGEIDDEQLNVHSEYIAKVLREESQSLRRKNDEKHTKEENKEIANDPNKERNNQDSNMETDNKKELLDATVHSTHENKPNNAETTDIDKTKTKKNDTTKSKYKLIKPVKEKTKNKKSPPVKKLNNITKILDHEKIDLNLRKDTENHTINIQTGNDATYIQKVTSIVETTKDILDNRSSEINDYGSQDLKQDKPNFSIEVSIEDNGDKNQMKADKTIVEKTATEMTETDIGQTIPVKVVYDKEIENNLALFKDNKIPTKIENLVTETITTENSIWVENHIENDPTRNAIPLKSRNRDKLNYTRWPLDKNIFDTVKITPKDSTESKTTSASYTRWPKVKRKDMSKENNDNLTSLHKKNDNNTSVIEENINLLSATLDKNQNITIESVTDSHIHINPQSAIDEEKLNKNAKKLTSEIKDKLSGPYKSEFNKMHNDTERVNFITSALLKSFIKPGNSNSNNINDTKDNVTQDRSSGNSVGLQENEENSKNLEVRVRFQVGETTTEKFHNNRDEDIDDNVENIFNDTNTLRFNEKALRQILEMRRALETLKHKDTHGEVSKPGENKTLSHNNESKIENDPILVENSSEPEYISFINEIKQQGFDSEESKKFIAMKKALDKLDQNKNNIPINKTKSRRDYEEYAKSQLKTMKRALEYLEAHKTQLAKLSLNYESNLTGNIINNETTKMPKVTDLKNVTDNHHTKISIESSQEPFNSTVGSKGQEYNNKDIETRETKTRQNESPETEIADKVTAQAITTEIKSTETENSVSKTTESVTPEIKILRNETLTEQSYLTPVAQNDAENQFTTELSPEITTKMGFKHIEEQVLNQVRELNRKVEAFKHSSDYKKIEDNINTSIDTRRQNNDLETTENSINTELDIVQDAFTDINEKHVRVTRNSGVTNFEMTDSKVTSTENTEFESTASEVTGTKATDASPIPTATSYLNPNKESFTHGETETTKTVPVTETTDQTDTEFTVPESSNKFPVKKVFTTTTASEDLQNTETQINTETTTAILDFTTYDASETTSFLLQNDESETTATGTQIEEQTETSNYETTTDNTDELSTSTGDVTVFVPTDYINMSTDEPSHIRAMDTEMETNNSSLVEGESNSTSQTEYDSNFRSQTEITNDYTSPSIESNTTEETPISEVTKSLLRGNKENVQAIFELLSQKGQKKLDDTGTLSVESKETNSQVYKVFEVPPGKPHFVEQKQFEKPLVKTKLVLPRLKKTKFDKPRHIEKKSHDSNQEAQFYVPVYNYAPEKAYFNSKNLFGPNLNDNKEYILREGEETLNIDGISNRNEDQPYLAPVYNYGAENAYFNPANRYGPHINKNTEEPEHDNSYYFKHALRDGNEKLFQDPLISKLNLDYSKEYFEKISKVKQRHKKEANKPRSLVKLYDSVVPRNEENLNFGLGTKVKPQLIDNTENLYGKINKILQLKKSQDHKSITLKPAPLNFKQKSPLKNIVQDYSKDSKIPEEYNGQADFSSKDIDNIVSHLLNGRRHKQYKIYYELKLPRYHNEKNFHHFNESSEPRQVKIKRENHERHSNKNKLIKKAKTFGSGIPNSYEISNPFKSFKHHTDAHPSRIVRQYLIGGKNFQFPLKGKSTQDQSKHDIKGFIGKYNMQKYDPDKIYQYMESKQKRNKRDYRAIQSSEDSHRTDDTDRFAEDYFFGDWNDRFDRKNSYRSAQDTRHKENHIGMDYIYTDENTKSNLRTDLDKEANNTEQAIEEIGRLENTYENKLNLTKEDLSFIIFLGEAVDAIPMLQKLEGVRTNIINDNKTSDTIVRTGEISDKHLKEFTSLLNEFIRHRQKYKIRGKKENGSKVSNKKLRTDEISDKHLKEFTGILNEFIRHRQKYEKRGKKVEKFKTSDQNLRTDEISDKHLKEFTGILNEFIRHRKKYEKRGKKSGRSKVNENLDESLEALVKIIEEEIYRDRTALAQYDWLGTAVNVQSALSKLYMLINKIQDGSDIDPSDIELLKYTLFLHKSCKKPEKYSTERKNNLPKPHRKTKERKFVKIKAGTYFVRNSMESGDVDEIQDLKNLINELQIALSDPHEALKQIAIMSTYKSQDLYKDLKDLYLYKPTRKKILQVILHLSLNRLFDNIEDTILSGKERFFEEYTKTHSNEIEKTKEEFSFVMKLLNELDKEDRYLTRTR